jgi:hypothetical protein
MCTVYFVQLEGTMIFQDTFFTAEFVALIECGISSECIFPLTTKTRSSKIAGEGEKGEKNIWWGIFFFLLPRTICKLSFINVTYRRKDDF